MSKTGWDSGGRSSSGHVALIKLIPELNQNLHVLYSYTRAIIQLRKWYILIRSTYVNAVRFRLLVNPSGSIMISSMINVFRIHHHHLLSTVITTMTQHTIAY